MSTLRGQKIVSTNHLVSSEETARAVGNVPATGPRERGSTKAENAKEIDRTEEKPQTAAPSSSFEASSDEATETFLCCFLFIV